MMTDPSRLMWGYHYHGRQPGRADYLTHHERIRPTTTLIMDDPLFAIELKQRYPECEVIARNNPPGGMNGVYTRMTPQKFVEFQFSQVPPGNDVIYYVENEQALTPEYVAWNQAVAKLFVAAGEKCVVLNMSVGNPGDPADIPIARELLEYASNHPDLVKIGLNEYCDLHWTSGIENASRHNPPTDITKHTCWHMGRFQFWIDWCKHWGIQVKFIFCEWGWDGVEQKQHTGQWENKPVWQQWYPHIDWQQHAAQQLLDAQRVIYAPFRDWIDGIIAYCWLPYDREKWAREDFQNMPRFREYVEENLPMPVEIPSDPPLKDTGYHTLGGISTRLNFRATPSLSGTQIGQIAPGDIINLTGRYDSANGYEWREGHVQRLATTGWFAMVDGLTLTPAETPSTVDLDVVRVKVKEAQRLIDEVVTMLE